MEPALGYLPAYGTLMVDAMLSSTDPTVEDEIIQCAVHYVDDGEQVRYCVKPATNGQAEPLDVSMVTNLGQLAAEWPLTHARRIEGVVGETLHAPTVPIHLGPVWLGRRARGTPCGRWGARSGRAAPAVRVALGAVADGTDSE